MYNCHGYRETWNWEWGALEILGMIGIMVVTEGRFQGASIFRQKPNYRSHETDMKLNCYVITGISSNTLVFTWMIIEST